MSVELFTHSLFSDANLVSYWRLEGNSNDSKGSNNGTDTAMSYSTANGRFGQGSSFNGSTSRTSFGTSVLNLNSTDFTINAWVNIASYGANPNVIFAKNDTSGILGYIFMISNGGYVMAWEYDNAGVWSSNNTSTNAIPINEWHMVSYVHTHSTANVKLFLDGVKRADGTGKSWTSTNSVKPSIGAATDAGSSLAYPFNGKIDDVSIFNRQLTEIELYQFYQYNISAMPSHFRV